MAQSAGCSGVVLGGTLARSPPTTQRVGLIPQERVAEEALELMADGRGNRN